MKKLYLAILVGSLLSCKKNMTVELVAEQDLIKKAKSYFEVEVLTKESYTAATKNNGLSPLNDKRSYMWNDAYTINFNGRSSVIVPVEYKSPFVMTSNLNRNRLYSPNSLIRLLIYPDETNHFHTQQLIVLPDSSYTGGNRFSGVVLFSDPNGKATKGFQYSGNGTVYELTLNSNNQSRGSFICIEYSGYNYSPINGEYYYWTQSGGCYYFSDPSPEKFMIYDVGENAGGGGDSGGGYFEPVNTFTIAAGDNVIANVQDYLKCFDNIPGNDHTYQVTVCVAQPKPGSREAWGFTNAGSSPVDVGHTFLILTEKTTNKIITRNVGFYPAESVWPYDPIAPGQLNNDANKTYNVSLTITMTSSEFTNVVNYISQQGYQYNLNDNNCTTFALNALSSAGYDLPRTKGIWSGGSGLNPGDLGEDIRQMNVSPNMTKNTAFNAHPNMGDCL